MRYFYLSYIVTIVGMILAYWWAGVDGLIIAGLLTIMEVSLSFDNAVVNATVLKTMSEKWQRRFLTWGILIAVFGMRLVFPVVIVAFATGLSMLDVSHLALDQPDEYSRHVLASHIQIAAFGGMFLLMVFLKFVCNEGKDLHWIGFIEHKLAALGKLESAEVIVALTVLLIAQSFLPEEARGGALIAGTVGVVLYVVTTSLTALFAGGAESGGAGAEAAVKSVGYSGLMGFIYLQFLDASFSLDGVIGAFAISKDVIIIMIGLGVGAMFVRSLTVYMVRKGTLDDYIYLEHGAHWGIGALAAIMLTSMVHHVPEVITGLIGVSFILLSLVSSVRHNRAQQKH
ncbi:MAG: DUF475 domain-containing protein [Rickettsiales bacterium]